MRSNVGEMSEGGIRFNPRFREGYEIRMARVANALCEKRVAGVQERADVERANRVGGRSWARVRLYVAREKKKGTERAERSFSTPSKVNT